MTKFTEEVSSISRSLTTSACDWETDPESQEIVWFFNSESQCQRLNGLFHSPRLRNNSDEASTRDSDNFISRSLPYLCFSLSPHRTHLASASVWFTSSNPISRPVFPTPMTTLRFSRTRLLPAALTLLCTVASSITVTFCERGLLHLCLFQAAGGGGGKVGGTLSLGLKLNLPIKHPICTSDLGEELLSRLYCSSSMETYRPCL